MSVCIVGVGFVGLHLVECFSRKYKVIGFDILPKRIEYLKNQHACENVTYTSNIEEIKNCQLFCVSVPTLLSKAHTVDLSVVENAIKMLQDFVTPTQTVVLESSVSVGTSRRVLRSLYEKGIKVGFSPERVDPGRTEPAAHEIAKVVSGYDMECLSVIHKWYSSVYNTVVPVSSMETAEMCKLYENCFRMINIAYVNEISDECVKHHIDPKEMIQACSSKPYGYMPFSPGLGVGGTCIPVNPYYLFTNNDLPLLKCATSQTENRPIKKATEIVNKHNPQKVLVVGVAYKPGESITYCSPTIPFMNTLSEKGVTVEYYDPLVEYPGYTRISSNEWNPEYLNKIYDVICVCTKQTGIDFSVLNNSAIPNNKIVVF
jgi:nucleotide sugar dehydrogenase